MSYQKGSEFSSIFSTIQRLNLATLVYIPYFLGLPQPRPIELMPVVYHRSVTENEILSYRKKYSRMHKIRKNTEYYLVIILPHIDSIWQQYIRL